MAGIVDSTDALVVEYKFDVWGRATYASDQLPISNWLCLLNPFRYRGYIYDSETWMYWLRSRYYYPELHRFISADNVMDGKGVLSANIYSYCRNDSILRKDNGGNSWEIAWPSLESYRNAWQMMKSDARDIVNCIEIEAGFGGALGFGGKIGGIADAEAYAGIDTVRIVLNDGRINLDRALVLEATVSLYEGNEIGLSYRKPGSLSDSSLDIPWENNSNVSLANFQMNGHDVVLGIGGSLGIGIGGHCSVGFNMTEFTKTNAFRRGEGMRKTIGDLVKQEVFLPWWKNARKVLGIYD